MAKKRALAPQKGSQKIHNIKIRARYLELAKNIFMSDKEICAILQSEFGFGERWIYELIAVEREAMTQHFEEVCQKSRNFLAEQLLSLITTTENSVVKLKSIELAAKFFGIIQSAGNQYTNINNTNTSAPTQTVTYEIVKLEEKNKEIDE